MPRIAAKGVDCVFPIKEFFPSTAASAHALKQQMVPRSSRGSTRGICSDSAGVGQLKSPESLTLYVQCTLKRLRVGKGAG